MLYDEFSSACQGPIELVIIMDSSGSINDAHHNNYNWQKSAAGSALHRFHIGPDTTRVSVVRFSNKAKIWFGFTKYDNIQDLTIAINDITYTGGWTNTSGALLRAIQLFRGNDVRPHARLVLLLLTDGEENIDTQYTRIYTSELKRLAVDFYSVGVSPNVTKEHLVEIVGSEDNVYIVDTFKDMMDRGEELFRKMCNSDERCDVETTTLVSLTNTPPDSQCMLRFVSHIRMGSK